MKGCGPLTIQLWIRPICRHDIGLSFYQICQKVDMSLYKDKISDEIEYEHFDINSPGVVALELNYDK